MKDSDQRVWVVSTATHPPQHLVTIPWVDAFRGIKREAAPDYFEALATCQSSHVTALTQKEEDEVMAELAGIVATKRASADQAGGGIVAKKRDDASGVPEVESGANVVSLATFRKKGRA